MSRDPGPRIVSLVPSVTETLLTWGMVPVGVTRFCEQPHLDTVGGTKNPDIARILALAPDLVVMDEEENRREDATALGASLPVHVTAVRSWRDVDSCLDALARAVGAERSEPERDAFHRLALEPAADARLRAFVPIWRRPWMTVGGDTYGSSLLRWCGVVNVYEEAPDRYPTVALEDVAHRRPDVVLLPTEPYSFEVRHHAEVAALGRTEVVDGKDLFWWGVRTPPASRRLRGQLAP